MDSGAWFLTACVVAVGLWYLWLTLSLIGVRFPRVRVPRWMRSQRLRAWRAARIRNQCHERSDCNCDIFILSHCEALYICNTHGLVRLIIGEKKVEELLNLMRRCREGNC